MGTRFPYFHDATPGTCSYKLSVWDHLEAFSRARELGWVDFNSFDVEEYEYFERVEKGDLNWLIPGKFCAFAGPHAKKSYDEVYPTCIVQDYIPHFRERKVELVVRLNKKFYDEDLFRKKNIKHLELYYLDGSNAPMHVLEQFIEACEQTEGAIAVHCKAGLGRTGTCIGAYMMKHYGLTAKQTIAWMRICRPGSVIGPQQQFLGSLEKKMHLAGDCFRKAKKAKTKARSVGYFSFNTGSPNVTPSYPSGVSPRANYENDEFSQGDSLRSRKSPQAKATKSLKIAGSFARQLYSP